MASENPVQQMETVKECAREPSPGETGSVETAQLEQAATNKTWETMLSVAVAPAPEVGYALATDQLPLIRLHRDGRHLRFQMLNCEHRMRQLTA
jgi:hypothetical protein